jgi:hypothetical protein
VICAQRDYHAAYMGLAISIGMLDNVRADEEGHAHYKAAFDRLSAYLASQGHPGFVEPEHVAATLPPHTSSFPYSFLHYLRRAFAHVRAGAKRVPPCPEGSNPADDVLIDEELTLHMDSHLVCHSDAEGFYVPIDFGDPLYPGDSDGVAGGIVGSSQQLVRELVRVAPAIGIELTAGKPSPAVLATLAKEGEGVSLYRERLVWLALYVNATASVEHKTVLVFH